MQEHRFNVRGDFNFPENYFHPTYVYYYTVLLKIK